MLNGTVLTSVVIALATTTTTLSFAHDRGPRATPAAIAKTGATQGTFTTSDAIPWKIANPKYPAVKMFAAWGNPNKGASETLLKFPSGYHAGWHWQGAAYHTVVIQGRFTHTLNQGGASQTGGPGSELSQPATQLVVDERVRDLPIAPEKPV